MSVRSSFDQNTIDVHFSFSENNWCHSDTGNWDTNSHSERAKKPIGRLKVEAPSPVTVGVPPRVCVATMVRRPNATLRRDNVDPDGPTI
jgi:hypothetical protein